MSTNSIPRCKSLVLDAGPLLSLSPLRGLAETYYTTPQVLAELKDNRAREHFERLGLNAGVKIEVREPDAASLSQVIQWAKQTGDYAVLSHTDLCVVALTHYLTQKAKVIAQAAETGAEVTANGVPTSKDQPNPKENDTADILSEKLGNITVEESEDLEQPTLEEEALEPLDVELHPIVDGSTPSEPASIPSHNDADEGPLFEDPSDSDDGEGEWITPTNVALHKSRALNLLPDDQKKSKKGGKQDDEVVSVGCMTADFAMQNVILQMGLSLAMQRSIEAILSLLREPVASASVSHCIRSERRFKRPSDASTS
ncbi:hypothetical protein ONZ45_g7221 [Pleurotus djamor]|nr:hypothetical protein ONZ45_g7221 [Pleurotus djamor]